MKRVVHGHISGVVLGRLGAAPRALMRSDPSRLTGTRALKRLVLVQALAGAG